MAKQKKTNAMRLLDQHQITYRVFEYPFTDKMTGLDIANINNLNPNKVYKTLVTQGATRTYYVFMVPVNQELNLKKAAKVTSEKKIELIPQNILLQTTGYIHGGCSPVGMKKRFQTIIHVAAADYSKLVCSGGRPGLQLEIPLPDLMTITAAEMADISD